MAVFKILRCSGCGAKRYDQKPMKEPPMCWKCGAKTYYLEQWYISYYVNGRKFIEAAGTQKKFAEDALAKRKVQIREGKFFEIKEEKTFQEGVKLLRQTYSRLDPDTVRMYENGIKNLQKHPISYGTLKQAIQHIDDFIASRKEKGVTNSTINRDLETLKRIAKLANCMELYQAIKLLKENEPRKRFLSREEIERLKKAIKESKSSYLQLAVLIALDTGLRKNSVLSLKWDEVNLQAGYIEKKTKGGKKVIIPLTNRLAEVLWRFREKQKVISLDGYIFSRSDGGCVADVKRAFKTACKKAGLEDVRWHDLRRTFGSHFVMATKDLVALQQLLGHSDFSVTRKHYAHLLDEHIVEAIRKYEQI